MRPDQMPDDVRRLVEERAAARAARDWSRADALRDELAKLGWEVQDAAGSSSARPVLVPAMAPADRLAEPATVAASIQVAAEDHGEDLVRCLSAIGTHGPPEGWELVVVANAPSFSVDDVVAGLPLLVQPVIVAAPGRLGWADARTLGLRASAGEVTVLVDTSIEATGDFLRPLLDAFDDPTVGIAGPWGVTSPDGRQFEESPPGEVDAIEGYCMAVRRDALRAVGGFDRRFRFYRNADLDFSFAVRSAGWRAVRTEPLPLNRHEHRGWTGLPEPERDRLSRRNFYRFLEHWGARPDLLTRAEEQGAQ